MKQYHATRGACVHTNSNFIPMSAHGNGERSIVMLSKKGYYIII